MNLKQLNSYLIRHPHIKITLYFLIFGFMWILLSDRALSILYSDIEEAYHLQTYKGWFFIVITTILIFVTSQNNFKKIIKLSSNLSRSEAILRESVRLNETLLNNIPNTDVFLFDNEMKILKTGGKEMTKMNFSLQNSSERKISDVLPTEIYDLLKPLFLKSLEGYDLNMEHNYKGIDYIYFTAPVRSSEKIVAGVLVSQNVTELKKVQRELNNRNVFIETILNNLPVGLAVNDDRSGKVEYMNDKFEEIYGWPLKNENLDGFFNTVYRDPDYRENIKNRVLKDINSGIPERMVWDNIHITTRKGNHRIISARNIPVKDQNLMVSIVTDVTETRKAERQIIESRNRYKAIFEHSPYPIWEEDFSQLNSYLESLKRKGVTDIENYLNKNPEEVKYMSGLIQIIDVNQASVRLFKATEKKQLFDRSIYTEPEESLDIIKQQMSGFFHRQSQMEFTRTNKDFQGNIMILRLRIVEIPSFEDDFKHILVSASDITNLAQTQKKLEEEKNKADLAIDSSGLGYWEADYTKDFYLINEQCARMLDYEKNDFVQTYSNFVKLVFPDDVEKLENIKTGQKDQLSLEVRIKTKNDKWKWVSINGLILERDGSGKAVRAIGTHRDMSYEREKEKELLKSFIEGKDKERNRIARELHDGIGQSLSAASLSFDFIRNESENLSYVAVERLTTGMIHLNEAIEETRNISQNLLPRTIEDFGLIPGIKQLILNIQKSVNIKIIFYENIGTLKMDQDMELQIYRIVQEALNNSIKHSDCTKINLQLIKHKTMLVITIEDDGKGFNKDEIDLNTGFGLRNIEARTKAMSGEFLIETSPEKGTCLIIEVEL